MSPDRQWTIMVYMAGDTGVTFEGPITGEQLFAELEGPMQEDLRKMQAAGSSEAVAVCVQFDSLSAGQAFRWHVPSRDDPNPTGPQPIGTINTGEPGSLSDFVAWAGGNWPAEHYALVIWGHGSGWDEERIYDRYPPPEEAKDEVRGGMADALFRRGIFGSAVGHILAIKDSRTRGLCYDDSSRDFLDNAELQRALCDAARHLRRTKLDVLGLDACLMNMLEVAYQIRDEASYLVGSETVVPEGLWPWTDILQALQAAPETSPAGLAVTIAERALGGSDTTRTLYEAQQSVLDLAQAEDAVALLDKWAALILTRYDENYDVEQAITRARDQSLRLVIPGQGEGDYVDLVHLLDCFVEEWTADDSETFMARPDADDQGYPDADVRLRRLSRRLLRRLCPGRPDSLVRCNVLSEFYSEPVPRGISIYLPPLDDLARESTEISPQYGNVAFSDTHWPELICKLYGQEGLLAAFVAERDKRRRGG